MGGVGNLFVACILFFLASLQVAPLFNLNADTITGIDREKCRLRLAQVFQASQPNLRMQHDSVHVIARKKKDIDHAEGFSAWRAAILELHGHMRELRKIVFLLGTWSWMTTTGVEHVHNMHLMAGRQPRRRLWLLPRATEPRSSGRNALSELFAASADEQFEVGPLVCTLGRFGLGWAWR